MINNNFTCNVCHRLIASQIGGQFAGIALAMRGPVGEESSVLTIQEPEFVRIHICNRCVEALRPVLTQNADQTAAKPECDLVIPAGAILVIDLSTRLPVQAIWTKDRVEYIAKLQSKQWEGGGFIIESVMLERSYPLGPKS